MYSILKLAAVFLLVRVDEALFLNDERSLYSFSNPKHRSDSDSVIHLPLYRRETRNGHGRCKRSSEVGLEDYLDVTYSVLVTLGNTTVPLIIDSGSSDLWAISDSSSPESSTNISLYPTATFKSSDINVHLEYGDSSTGTHADGLIGRDTVSLAGFTLRNHFFAAINDTNTTVLQTGSAGIFGLGFPLNSIIWRATFLSQHANMLNSSDSPMFESRQSSYTDPDLEQQASRLFPDLRFPIPSLLSSPSTHPTKHTPSRQNASSPVVHEVLASYATLGPFMARLVATDSLALPLFTIVLQRDTVNIGGNHGILSIGGFPRGIGKDNMIWTEVRGYPSSQGGLSAPSDAPNEVYPITWEIPIDDVFLDGRRLPRSSLSSPNITLSALLDTGNSLIRGPSDVIQAIYDMIGNTTFPCTVPHTLAFQISGHIFPVDPRNFVRQASKNTVALCEPNIAVTDSPKLGKGYLYSWSLGDPFLKSVITSFYFGNLSYPSKDPPRIGLLSTVPPDANARLEAAVSSGWIHDGNFPTISEASPTDSPTQTDPLQTTIQFTRGSRSGVNICVPEMVL